MTVAPAPAVDQSRLLWGAFFLAPLLYAGLALGLHLLVPDFAHPVPAQFGRWGFWILCPIAIGIALHAKHLVTRILPTAPGNESVAQKQNRFVLECALIEASAILGLCLFLISGALYESLTVLAIAWIGLWLNRPHLTSGQ